MVLSVKINCTRSSFLYGRYSWNEDWKMGKPLRIIIIEDSQDDTLLLLRELWRNDYEVEFERVETAIAMQTLLTEKDWDLILSDYTLPNFSAPQALEVLKAS